MFEVWYFSGNGDPMFGGNADDRVLYRKGEEFDWFNSRWAAKQRGFERASFDDAEAALQLGNQLAPAKALVSVIRA